MDFLNIREPLYVPKKKEREVTSGRFVRILLLEKHCILQTLGGHKDVPEMYDNNRILSDGVHLSLFESLGQFP